MKRILLTLAVFGSAVTASATDLFDQLVTFNYNWANYESRVPKSEAIDFPSDKEYIQKHLENVLKILRSNPTEHLSAEQLKMRVHLTGVLEDYKEAGLFPMNYYRNERIPVFIDEHNTHCAVGFLLEATGFEYVARRISETDNYAWVKDIHDPALPKWQEFSGFTLDELKLIQGAYDSYMPEAWLLPNRMEIPQKPEVIVRNFEGKKMSKDVVDNVMNVWCYGEGKGTTLHGKWIQNYRKGVPWIEGYYENGKRTGSWKEYYYGTKILCRTEHWRDDKLNGVRTRYDREGNVIERITFKDGEAIKKINYDLRSELEWIRIPVDSMTVKTEMYTSTGYLLARGMEKIHNPSGLLWFQNIELTALNTAAITARDGAPVAQAESRRGSRYSLLTGSEAFNSGSNLSNSSNSMMPSNPATFQQPSLVQYIKIGNWSYFNEYTPESYTITARSSREYLNRDFPHVGNELYYSFLGQEFSQLACSMDSIRVLYDNGQVQEFKGYSAEVNPHLIISYSDQEYKTVFSIYDAFNGYSENGVAYKYVESIGAVNQQGYRIGKWIYFDEFNRLIKTEEYHQPIKEEDELTFLD